MSPTAHPVTGHPHVDLPVVLVAAAAVLAVTAVVYAVPPSRAALVRRVVRHGVRREADREVPGASWAGDLTRPQVVTRVVAVVLLVVAAVAGRFGVDNELENLAPALVVGAGWPLLVLASLVVGPVWRWVDPWDSIGRVLSPGDTSDPPDQVWPAAVVALGWVWYLAASPRPLDPRTVGILVVAYTTVTLAGCLALGRRRWLASAEPLGILLTWLALAPRRRLADWSPPRGAEALLGVLAGGLTMAVLRRTEFWTTLLPQPASVPTVTAGLAAGSALGAALFLLAGHTARRLGQAAGVAAAMVPVVAGIALAAAIERNRLTTSLQLLPDLLSDPLGRGWDLVGTASLRLDPEPFGSAGLLALQLVVLLVCHAWGAIVSARGAERGVRLATAVLLAYTAGLTTVVLSLH